MTFKQTKSNKKLLGKFRSFLELDIDTWLTKIGVDRKYEPCKIPYLIPPSKPRKANYLPDFVIDPKNLKKMSAKSLTYNDLDGKVILEVKGRLTRKDANKMINVKKANPNLDIRMLFPHDRIFDKRKKGRRDGEPGLKVRGYRYSDWAIDNGFPYYVGKEPDMEWFK